MPQRLDPAYEPALWWYSWLSHGLYPILELTKQENYNIRNTNLLALKISLNMNIDVNNYCAKLEGCWAGSRVYKAGIMYLWLFSCDVWPNKYCHTWINDLSILWTEKWQGHIGVLKRVMEILWITSIHLLSIFDCKYNTNIMVPFSVMSCWLAMIWAAVPGLEPSFDSSAQLQAPTLLL